MSSRSVTRAKNAASLKRFSAGLEDMRQTVREDFDKQFRKQAITIYGGLVLTTPVDTGFARGRWGVGVNNGPLSSESGLDPSGQGAIARGRLAIAAAPEFSRLELGNDASYIIPLDNGFSPQRRSGIVDPVLRQAALRFR